MKARACAAALVALSAAIVAFASPPGAWAADPGQGCDPAGPPVLSTIEPPALAALGAQRAWELSTGHGVVVAIVDSGVDATNPHLHSVVLPGANLVGDGADAGGRADMDGHGTALAGVVAAQRIAGSQVVGLAPGARILPVRTFSDRSEEAQRAGTGPSAGRLALGIRYAADAGAQIINVSQSMSQGTDELLNAVEHAQQAGALVVASAGNRATASDSSDGNRYPAAYPGVLAVAAQGSDGTVTDASIHGPHVGITAPGANVITAYLGGGDCLVAGDEASSSMATAYVSAAAALVAAAHPNETPAQWLYRLQATAARPVPTQRDDINGWGAVEPVDAIELVIDPAAPGPPTSGHAFAGPIVHRQQTIAGRPAAGTASGTVPATLVGCAVVLSAGAALAMMRLLRRATTKSAS